MVELKQYDTARPLVDTLMLGGLPIDLTGSTIVFVMRPKTPENNAPATRYTGVAIVGPAINGQVSLAPTAPLVAIPGVFESEWEITFPTTKILTVPTHGYNLLKINPELDIGGP